MSDKITFGKGGEVLMQKGELIQYKPKMDKKKDRLKIIIIKNGTNAHYIMPYEPSEDTSVIINDVNYNVPVNKVMQLMTNIFQTLKDKINLFNRIRRWYVAFYKEGEPNPLEFKDAPESPITSINLSEVVFSKVIGLGVASLFRKKYNFDFNWKMILMVVVVVAVMIGLFFAWQTGVFKNLMGGNPA